MNMLIEVEGDRLIANHVPVEEGTHEFQYLVCNECSQINFLKSNIENPKIGDLLMSKLKCIE